MKKSFFFIKDKIKLHYTKSGAGEKSIFLFHGSGQTEKAFDEIRTYFENEYMVYCFDLFFHGQSSWLEEDLLTEQDWLSFFNDFLLDQKITQFSIVTFSLGTRFGLLIYQELYTRVENVWLIAPEGLRFHWLYLLATQTMVMRWIFYYIIKYPKYLLNFISVLNQMNLVPKIGYQLVKKFMSVKERRFQFYKTWVVFRKLKFDTQKVIALANQQNTQIIIFASEKDYIVSFKPVKAFFEKLKNGKIQVYQVDHFKLLYELTKYSNTFDQ